MTTLREQAEVIVEYVWNGVISGYTYDTCEVLEVQYEKGNYIFVICMFLSLYESDGLNGDIE